MKSLVIIINIVASLALLPALYMGLMAPMMFDSGATTRTWMLFGTVLAIPASIIVTQIISWVLFAKGLYVAALWVSCVPLLPVVLLVVLFTLSSSLT
jgi:hypothetical protein